VIQDSADDVVELDDVVEFNNALLDAFSQSPYKHVREAALQKIAKRKKI
jgi:hypothetical protein